MKALRHTLALFACAVSAWIAGIVWETIHPTPIPEYEGLGMDYSDPVEIYIWLGVFSILCFFWFFVDLKTKHD